MVNMNEEMFLQEHHVRILLAKSQACCGVSFDSKGSRVRGRCSSHEMFLQEHCADWIRDRDSHAAMGTTWSGVDGAASLRKFDEMFLQEHYGKLGG